ncbi:hypothetical protein [Ancylobacter sp. IITR112]|uniref:hypothetical protein n=1 Tax=Ancylobacter sp. IITR112 TaxID=3138073 RepID=UPI00352A2C74
MFGWLSGKRRRRQHLMRRTSECCGFIGDKWEWYKNNVAFEEDVSIGERIACFVAPIDEAIRKHYPDLVSPSGGTVMTLVLFGIASVEEIDPDSLAKACGEAAIIVGIMPEPMTVLI